MNQAIQELDARGLNCPLPILRVKKLLAGMDSGNSVRMLATDPGSLKDMEAFCKQTGNELVSSEKDAGIFIFIVRKH